MSAELELTFEAAAKTERRGITPSQAAKVLNGAVRFWFGVTLIGQLFFGVAVVSFYGLTALRGDYHGWAKHLTRSFTHGETVGNTAIWFHILGAMVIMLAGASQLIPSLRNRFPRFHRWTGRAYLVAVLTLSTGGLYMLWFRGKIAGDLTQQIGLTVNALLMLLCGVQAFRTAVARNFAAHRVWAIRLFLVVSASWIFRVVLFSTFLIFQRPVGFDPATFSGPLLSALAFLDYLLPLAVLELYLWARKNHRVMRRLVAAAVLSFVTLDLAAGIVGIGMAVWVPQVTEGFDTRKSIAVMLDATIASSGIDAAEKQYRQIKAGPHAQYNFDRSELQLLAGQLMERKKPGEAIRIYLLNAEAYPKSTGVREGLGEAYLAAGDQQLAMENFRKAVELDPTNASAAASLRKLETSKATR